MRIALFHLSDIHVKDRKCFDNDHIVKIASTLNSEKDISHVFILISGDISFSGTEAEYAVAKDIIGKLIHDIRQNMHWGKERKINVICVPGNHDINHSQGSLSSTQLQTMYDKNCYSDFLISENQKLREYNTFANFNRCDINGIRICRFDLNGFIFQSILLNSAIFSLRKEEDKGLHYISEEELKKLDTVTEADFSIAMMHHSTDFLIDTQKEKIDRFIFSKCNAFYYGHEHHSESKDVKYEDESSSILELCGSLCNNGDWSHSSFYLNVIDTTSAEYSQKKYCWINDDLIYKCVYDTTKHIESKRCSMFKMDTSFSKELFSDDKNPISQKFTDYFVFPRIKIINFKDNNTEEILDLAHFDKELMEKKTMRITGPSSSGKTALLKYCFLTYSSKFAVVFCDAENITGKNFSQIIKMNFQRNYGNESAAYDRFSQCPKSQKMVIIDNIDCIKEESFEHFLKFIKENFEYCIFSTKNWIDCEIKNRVESYFDISNNATRYELTPFYADKRTELINILTEILCDDKLEAKNISQLLLNCISKQKRFVSLDPDFLICYAKYYCKNIGSVHSADSSIFSKVFEANITNILSPVATGTCNVDKMFTILSKIAYSIHSHSLYPIPSSKIQGIVDDYNKEYGCNINCITFISKMEECKMLYSDGNGYRFKNRNTLAYFIAYEILTIYGDGEETENVQADITKIIKNSCFGINSDILMFISYMTKSVRLFLFVLNNALKYTEEWDEFVFEKPLPQILSYQAPHRISIASEHDIKQAKESELQEEKELVQNDILEKVDIYNYSEKDAEEPGNQIVRAAALLMVISKFLPSFEHNLKLEQKNRIINTIYRLPNMIFLKWAALANEEIDELVKFIYEHSLQYSHKKLSGEQISAGIQFTSFSFLLDLYNIAVSYSAKENTYEVLTNNFDYTTYISYKLEHVMMTEECGTESQLLNELVDLANEKQCGAENTCLRLIANHCIVHRKGLSREKQEVIKSKIFTSRPLKRFNKKRNHLIPSNNSTRNSAILIDRAKNQKKK